MAAPIPVTKPPKHENKFLTATAVRMRYGGVSDMTLYRWIRTGQLPKPRYINGRRYFPVAELDARDAALTTAAE